jgi:quercetin dioxygenase-like cupin family protein
VIDRAVDDAETGLNNSFHPTREFCMGKVRVHDREDIEWVTLRSLYPEHMAAKMTDAELDSTLSNHEPGTDGSLHLSEYRYLPNATFDLHAHDGAEIIYVLEGSMILGNRIVGPGSSVFIGDHTLYGFAAGEQGLRMLIFMADGKRKYFSKEEFLRIRTEMTQEQPLGRR